MADKLLLLSDTVVRSRDAPDKITIPVVLVPPTTLPGLNVTPTTATGDTVSVVVLDMAARDALRVTLVVLAAPRVAIPNVPLTAP